MTTSPRTRTIAIAKTIKVLIRKGDEAFDKAAHARGKAEDFYIAAGLHLKKLKAAKPERVTWEDYVERHCHIGIRRAQELIAIADGRTTLEKVRASKAESMRRLRAHHGGAPLDRQAIAENRVAALVAAKELPAPVTKWLADHPGKTLADFVTATGPPALNPDAVIERKPIGIEVVAYSLVLPLELDQIIDKLRDVRTKVNWLGDYLRPQDAAAAAEQYRKIITTAQDTVVRLTGDRHTRFQLLPGTGNGHDDQTGDAP
jgi:hypothetical protein